MFESGEVHLLWCEDIYSLIYLVLVVVKTCSKYSTHKSGKSTAMGTGGGFE